MGEEGGVQLCRFAKEKGVVDKVIDPLWSCIQYAAGLPHVRAGMVQPDAFRQPRQEFLGHTLQYPAILRINYCNHQLDPVDTMCDF
jgi:hypothetical protein